MGEKSHRIILKRRPLFMKSGGNNNLYFLCGFELFSAFELVELVLM